MAKNIPISPELVKLAQLRSRHTGLDVKFELAKQIVQESIYGLDPELSYVVEEDLAFSHDDRLVSVFEVNDIVVNNLRFDIRILSEDNRVSVPRFFVGSQYLSVGSFVVSFNPDRTASVVGFVPLVDWDLQDKHADPKDDRLYCRVNSHFDLAECLHELFTKFAKNDKKFDLHKQSIKSHVNLTELAKFISNRQEMKLLSQKELFDTVLSDPETWSGLEHGVNKAFVRKTLSHASVWNQKLDKLVSTIQPKLKHLSKDELKAQIAKIGEQLGGQTDSPAFRKEILFRLTKEELAHNLSGTQLNKANVLVEQILSGKKILDALSETVRNKAAIDVALSIKKQRQKLNNFIEASAEELSMAFRQLAPAPVYATHSTDDQAGVEAINETLNLLDACELAVSLKEIENDLLNI